MAIEQRWDVKRESKIFSALSFGQVTRLIAKGLLKEDDLIWHSGLSGWRKAGEVEELKPFFQELKKKE